MSEFIPDFRQKVKAHLTSMPSYHVQHARYSTSCSGGQSSKLIYLAQGSGSELVVRSIPISDVPNMHRLACQGGRKRVDWGLPGII